MTDWKRLLDIMKDNAGNAWDTKSGKEGYHEFEGQDDHHEMV